MKTLSDHLRDVDPLDYFAPAEMNYIILFTYSMLTAVVREECDTIAFTANDVTWSKDGLPVRQRQESPLQTVTFRETMRQIVKHDPVVREWARPVRRDSPLDMDVYQIAAPTLAEVALGDEAARIVATIRS
jgi:hypothetical protein